MKSNEFKLNITHKTRFLNLIRRVFKLKPIENLLVRKIQNLPNDSLWVRLMPPNYLYPRNSWRRAQRAGVSYSLDISDYMEHAVYFGYQDTVRNELLIFAKDKKVIIDVGVNLGVISLTIAKAFPESVVFGFEPDPKNFQKAKTNLDLNKLKNLEIIQKGLGATTTTVKLFKVNEDNEGMNRILNSTKGNFKNNFDFIEIDIIKLDDFVKEKPLDQIDLIKIDVEGYELQVLKGAERSLKKWLPILFIELDDDNLKEQNDSAQLLVEFLHGLGYKIRRAENRKELSSTIDFSHCHYDIICQKKN